MDTVYEYILFPGRHHVLTTFQHDYFQSILREEFWAVQDINGQPIKFVKKPNLVWAVTSANHSGTRRNPIPGHRREVAIEFFMEDLAMTPLVYLVPDVGTTHRFAEYILREIEVQSEGTLRLTPENTIVACSTPSVIAMYETLGFRILPVELGPPNENQVYPRPWDRVQDIVRAGWGWQTCPSYRNHIHKGTRLLFNRYRLGDVIIRAHEDIILTDDGNLTSSRDYNTYARAFDTSAARKYTEIKDHIVPGRIADFGSANGGILEQMGKDPRLAESDLEGTEITWKLYNMCLQRKENGDFHNPNTFIHHHNCVTDRAFRENSMDTILTVALTHEVYSYGSPEDLTRLLKLISEQLKPGGVYINLDVIGPDDPDKLILARYIDTDGKQDDGRDFDPNDREGLKTYLATLSTYGRFQRFTRDFRPGDARIAYTEVKQNGIPYIMLRSQDDAEFRSKKDYLDNWLSEMHERFCFANFANWQYILKAIGLEVDPVSSTFTNPWIEKNRWEGVSDIFDLEGNPIKFPPTTMKLVARKPR